MNSSLLARLLEDRATKRPVVLATRLGSGHQALLYPLDDGGTGDPTVETVAAPGGPTVIAAHAAPAAGLPASAATGGPGGSWPAAEARRALLEDRSFTVESPEDDARGNADGEADGEACGGVFLRAYNPPVRVVIVGAVHIAQPLARMAQLAEFDVFVVDPRQAFATAERFPDVELVHAWPDEALADLRPDHRTALVTVTHDPKLDDPGIVGALNSPAFYIGALGSRRTHAKRVARLQEQGFSAEDIARIHGPIGLPIGARGPAEIAVAILGQIIESLRVVSS